MFESGILQLDMLLDRGGPVMWTLAIIAMIVWSGLIEHLMYLREVTPGLRKQAMHLAELPTGIRSAQLRRMHLNRARSQLQRALPLLRTLVVLCPLLGLTGTVLGMMEVFDGIAALGTTEPRALSNGISQAVLTTMAGLMIALPALYLVSLVERSIQRVMQRLSLDASASG